MAADSEATDANRRAVRVVYEDGRFMYHDDETGRTWFREANLTESMVRRHSRHLTAKVVADTLAKEVAYEVAEEDGGGGNSNVIELCTAKAVQ
jgi:hypothetical protein